MADRDRSWLASLAHLSAIAQLLLTLGVLGALALGLEAFLGVVLALSSVERVILGVCAFLVILGLVLAVVNHTRKRRASEKDSGGSTRITQQDKAPEQLNTEELHKRFYAQPLQKLEGTTFVSERIPLDGFHYDHCTFERCTFVYRGEKPFSLTHFEIRGNDNTIEAHTPRLHEFSRLLVALKFIRPEIEVPDELQPTQDVALGFRFVKTTDLSKLSEEELKQRCLELAQELQNFMHACRNVRRDAQLNYTYPNETETRFNQRHKWKVDELREELDMRGGLPR